MVTLDFLVIVIMSLFPDGTVSHSSSCISKLESYKMNPHLARVESMYVTPEISGVDLSSRPAYWREIELVLSRGVINN